MNLPKIDISELRRIQEENLKDRLAFIEQYVSWLKRTPNKEWSAQRRALTERADSSKKLESIEKLLTNSNLTEEDAL